MGMSKTQIIKGVPFVLRTKDENWIKRNAIAVASVDPNQDQRYRSVLVMVPTVDQVTFMGREWVRHSFVNPPRDAPSPHIMCPQSDIDSFVSA
jgi:hypothetical protein